MVDYDLFCNSYLSGSAGYVEPLKRGYAEVYSGERRYVYDMRGRRSPSQFRAWVKRVFVDRSCFYRKMSGKYPRYQID